MKGNPFKIQEGSVRDSRVKNFTSGRNDGDSVIFAHSANWVGKSLNNKTIIIFYAFLLFMFLTLFFRAFYLEVVSGAEYFSKSEGNRIKKIVEKAPRGIIYDRFDRELVYNTSHFYLYIDPNYLADDISYLENSLENILQEDISLEDVIGYNTQLIKEKIPYEQALELMTLSRLEPAVVVRLEPTREYVTDVGLAHVLGYISQINEKELAEKPNYSFNDVLGKTGIEYQYESLLRGTDGYTQVETDALGRESLVVAEIDPKPGDDITLSIDLDLQEKLYSVLQSISDDYDKPRSAGVVMNPHNGEVLALASLPTYDNNLFTSRLDKEEFQKVFTDEDQPLFTRAISGEYPPGSTFKIIVGSAGLQEGIIDENFGVNSVGGLDINGYFYPDWRPGGHGYTTIYKAIADSVNTFFYIVGGGDNESISGLGLEKIVGYAKRFGLTKALGIDLPGEAEGFLPSRKWKEEVKGERWYLGDTYNISIGQGDVLVTPLQVARYTSLIASEGKEITPHLFKKIANTNEAEEETKTVDWLSIDNLDIMKQALRRTVVDGSASSLQSVSVPVSGKTGTAQFRRDKTPHSWFTGFAPYDNPELVVTIIIEEGGDQGLAVRAARLFLESIYNE